MFLTLALVRGEWSSSHTGCFTPVAISPSTCQIGGWGCPRSGLDDVERTKSCLYWYSNSSQLVTRQCTNYAVLVPEKYETLLKHIKKKDKKSLLFLHLFLSLVHPSCFMFYLRQYKLIN
jgi:hypothetical protein